MDGHGRNIFGYKHLADIFIAIFVNVFTDIFAS